MKQLGLLGLIGTLVGGGFAVLGGLLALLVFVARGDTTSRGVVGALGLYFLGKGIAVAGLGLLSFVQASPVRANSVPPAPPRATRPLTNG